MKFSGSEEVKGQKLKQISDKFLREGVEQKLNQSWREELSQQLGYNSREIKLPLCNRNAYRDVQLA